MLALKAPELKESEMPATIFRYPDLANVEVENYLEKEKRGFVSFLVENLLKQNLFLTPFFHKSLYLRRPERWTRLFMFLSILFGFNIFFMFEEDIAQINLYMEGKHSFSFLISYQSDNTTYALLIAIGFLLFLNSLCWGNSKRLKKANQLLLTMQEDNAETAYEIYFDTMKPKIIFEFVISIFIWVLVIYYFSTFNYVYPENVPNIFVLVSIALIYYFGVCWIASSFFLAAFKSMALCCKSKCLMRIVLMLELGFNG